MMCLVITNFVTGAVLTVVKLCWCVYRPTHSGVPTGQFLMVCPLWPIHIGVQAEAKMCW